MSEYPAGSEGVAFANARILQASTRLSRCDSRGRKPLRDLLAYVVSATRSPDGHEIPIYIDPGSVEEIEKALETPVKIDLEGVPLRTTLELALHQCELLYTVKGGVIIVDNGADSPDYVPIASSDPFLAIGQSLLALLAAGVGGGVGCPRLRPREGKD